MKQIRNGIFETNSSSTHAIVLADKNVPAGPRVDFAIGEFGWEKKILNTTDEKASYLYTMACELEGKDVYQRLYEMLVKYGVDVERSIPPKFGEYGLDNGYVDHCCDDDAHRFVNQMLSHEHALIRYLFSDQSFVITSNDNLWPDEYNPMEELSNVDYPCEVFYKGN